MGIVCEKDKAGQASCRKRQPFPANARLKERGLVHKVGFYEVVNGVVFEIHPITDGKLPDFVASLPTNEIRRRRYKTNSPILNVTHDPA